MTGLINQAYFAIKDAPLRYYVEAYMLDYTPNRQDASRTRARQPESYVEAMPKTDWIEYSIRFACGAVFGALVGFRSFLFTDRATALVAGTAVPALGFGILAARYGDRFWHNFFRHWWLWQ